MDNQVQAQQQGPRREVSKSPITVDKVDYGLFPKAGMEQAQLRQIVNVKSFYPAARIQNSMSDQLFGVNEFASLEEKEFDSTETRVAWMPVPEGTTVETVQERLAKNPGAHLYRVLSNYPVFTEEQEQAIKAGLKTKDELAMKQIVRYPEGSRDAANLDISNEMILDQQGRIQYKQNYFTADAAKEDIDRRSKDPEDYYVPQELIEEHQGAKASIGQTI